MQEDGYKKPNASQKQKMKDNQQTLLIYLGVTVAIDVLYYVIRVWWFGELSRTVWFLFLLCQVFYALSLQRLYAFSKPIRSSSAFFVNDFNEIKGTMTEFFQDILIVQWLLQVLGLFTDYAWMLYLVVPGYAIYKIFDKFIAPLWRMRSQFSQFNPSALGGLNGAAGESESGEVSKRQQKLRKKEEKLEKEGKLIRKTVKQ